MHVIDDGNWESYARQTIDRYGEYGCLPRDYNEVPLGSMPYTSPFAESFQLIPESEWNERIRAMQGRFIRDLYSGTVQEDCQNGLNYCWNFSLSQALKGARDQAGLPHVDLLAESLGRDVGWRNVGNYCGSAIECAARFGFAERSYSPERYNLRTSTWKDGWEENAKTHRVTEWWELGHQDMRAEVITALLLGYGVYVGLDWAGHAMWFSGLLHQDGKIATYTPNTWYDKDAWILTGDRMVPNEGYVVRTTTWSNT